MTEDAKTYVFGNSDSMAPLMAAMNNGGFGGNAWWPLIFLFALWGGNGGWGGNGTRGTETILSTLNGDQGRDMIMAAIQGNATAISQLASTVNCDINSVQAALNSIQGSICQLGNTVGMSGQQIINAIQAGDASLASKLSECCCENRLAISEQTNFLGAKIDYQTTFLSDKFCELEKRELQNKIDALRDENSTLKGQISNGQQTAAIQSYVAGLINPLITDVAAIKAAQPPTVAVPYPQLSAVPSSYVCAATAAGVYPYGPFYGTNGAWA